MERHNHRELVASNSFDPSVWRNAEREAAAQEAGGAKHSRVARIKSEEGTRATESDLGTPKSTRKKRSKMQKITEMFFTSSCDVTPDKPASFEQGPDVLRTKILDLSDVPSAGGSGKASKSSSVGSPSSRLLPRRWRSHKKPPIITQTSQSLWTPEVSLLDSQPF